MNSHADQSESRIPAVCMAAHAVCRRILLLLHLILQHHIPPVFLRRDAADAPENLREINLFDKAKVYGQKLCHISFWVGGFHMALLGAFVFDWPVMAVYILMCADEIVKLPWLCPRYKKYLWVNNMTREET